MMMSSRTRRRLDRRRIDDHADRLVERLQGEVIAIPRDVSLREIALLVTERAVIVARRSSIPDVLLELGLSVAALGEILGTIAEDRRDDGLHFVALVFVDGLVEVGFTPSFHLSRGGVT